MRYKAARATRLPRAPISGYSTARVELAPLTGRAHEAGARRPAPACATQWCACRIRPMNTLVSSAKMYACRKPTKIFSSVSATVMTTGPTAMA
jgi:hypothetical protein